MFKLLVNSFVFSLKLFVGVMIWTYMSTGEPDPQKAALIGIFVGIGYFIGLYTAVSDLRDAMNVKDDVEYDRNNG